MALASLVAISGPKKVSISRANPLPLALDFFGPKKVSVSRAQRPNPLPLALVMDRHASKTLRTGPYKSCVHKYLFLNGRRGHMRIPGPLPGLLLLLPQALQDVRGISWYSSQTIFWSQVSDWAFFSVPAPWHFGSDPSCLSNGSGFCSLR